MLPQPILAAALLALLPALSFAAVEIHEQPGKVTVAVGGAPFTEYCFAGAAHVYFYPLLGPGGARMTRDWPMASVESEEHDHPHHRSLWFAHGNVNGVDFWAEEASFSGKPSPLPLGRIVHDKFLKMAGGAREGVIQALNRWEAPDGTVPLTSTETLRVYETSPDERLFDVEEVLKAGTADVRMGDTKEGTMALRIAESMRLTQPKGNKAAGQGHMVNSEGVKDGDVWGQRAAWVDYSGPVDGKILGIAFMDHPQNPKHPTRWHARDYGLFAANPFCEHDMNKAAAEHSGDIVIPAGQSLTLRYRFLLHEGDATAAKIAQRYEEYMREK